MTLESQVVTGILILNLILVLVSLWLFVRLFRAGSKKTLLFCWKLILFGVIIFVLETVLTLLRTLGTFNMPRYVNGLFEMVILSLFIYVVLFQRTAILSAVNKHGK